MSHISPMCEITIRDRCYVSIHRLARSIFHLPSDRFFTLLHYYYLAHNVILAYLSITHPLPLFCFTLETIYFSFIAARQACGQAFRVFARLLTAIQQLKMAYKLCELSLLVAGKQLCETLNSLHPHLLKILFKISHISPMCEIITRDRVRVQAKNIIITILSKKDKQYS